MTLYDGWFRGYDYAENDVDIDVCLATVLQNAQQQDFREIGQQFLYKICFLFPFRQETNRNLLVINDVV
jgi:fido (protein-threonine AMPylation protein)